MTRRRKSLPPPPHLPPEGVPIWRQVVHHLKQNGLLAPVHAGLVETYVLAVLRQRALYAEFAAADRPKPSAGAADPLWRAIEASAGTVKSMARALGLTATPGRAPTKQQAPKNGGADVWGKILS